MTTKKKSASKAPEEGAAPVAATAAPTKAKFPAGSRKKKGDEPAESITTAGTATTATQATPAPAEAPATVAPTHDAIRARAFAIWKERGGSAVENWLQAEAELRGQG